MDTRNSAPPFEYLVKGGHDETTRNCRICHQDFTNNRGLRQHIGKIHKKSEKKIRCDQCRKKFKTKHSLKAHKLNVHDKVTQVSCPECNKVFSSKYILLRHKKIQHPITPRIE